MARGKLILDRYQPLGKAGSGGYGTVQVAWDPRIQRKVAIKTIELSETDVLRAVLPGAADDGRVPYDASQLDAPNNAQDERGAPDGSLSGALTMQFSPAGSDLDSGGDGTGGAPGAGGQEDLEPERFAATAPASVAEDGLHVLAKVPGLDEARTAAMLQDPRIVTVYDVEIRGHSAYLIMEYVEGITLTRLLRDYGEYLSLDITAAVFDSVAGALAAAHQKGVLHLDIKPDNVLINTKGQVKVTDFGLATLADAGGRGTAGGGTIGYMPLEQMRREQLDARTDEWSLAAVTYEMLTGENPFFVPSLDDAEDAITSAELVLPSLCWDNLDPEADDVVFYALDPDRDERYATVADFAEEMDKFLGNAAQGAEDLEIIVAHALDLLPEPDPAIGASVAGDAAVQGAYDRRAADDSDEAYAQERPPRPPAVPVRDRLTARMLGVAGRVFAAVACALVALLAVRGSGVFSLATQPGIIAAVVAAVVAAACAAVRPHIGALVAFCLLGVSLIFNNLPFVGAGFIVVSVIWWWLVARHGIAEANCALALPFVGGVGAFACGPLLSGALLRPRYAVGNAVFAVLVAVVLNALCSGDFTGWRVFFYWENGAVYGTLDRLTNMATEAQIWCVALSWILGSLVESVLCQLRKPILSVVGVILAAAIMIAGIFGYAWFASNMSSLMPTFEFVWPIVLSALVMIVVVVWLRPTEELRPPAHGRHNPHAS